MGILKKLDYAAIARSDPKLAAGMVYCHTCGRAQQTDSARSLRKGWPKCCGFTMSLDSPEERRQYTQLASFKG